MKGLEISPDLTTRKEKPVLSWFATCANGCFENFWDSNAWDFPLKLHHQTLIVLFQPLPSQYKPANMPKFSSDAAIFFLLSHLCRQEPQGDTSCYHPVGMENKDSGISMPPLPILSNIPRQLLSWHPAQSAVRHTVQLGDASLQ